MIQGIIYQYTLAGKYYVGKTYMEQRKRIAKHKYEALTLKKEHPFCRAIRKFGWEEALKSYTVLEVILDEDKQSLNKKLVERESYWIQEKNSIVPNGYNIYTKGQERIPHTQRKEEIYKKVSDSLKGKYMNCAETSRPVFCVEQNKWYPSISEAERINKVGRGSVGKAASGVNCHAAGLTWNFTGKLEPSRKDLLRERSKRLFCVDTMQEFSSIYEAAKWIWGDKASKKKCGLQAALKRNGTVCGFKFEYIDK